jgi:hypothetical protein
VGREQLFYLGGVALARRFVTAPALPAEATIQQMRRNQQHRATDAQNEFHCEVKTFAFPCDEQDEAHSNPDQREQRPAPMLSVSGNESGKSYQDDADGQPSMEGRVSREVRNDIRKQADDDRCKQAMNHADRRSSRSGDICVAVKTGKRQR